jgi:plastocyanin
MKSPFRVCSVLLKALLLLLVSTQLRAATTSVTVLNNSFTPKTVTINVGDTVTWIFREAGHDTVNKAGSTYGNIWDSGIKPINSTFSFTFTTAGTYPYVCTPHEFSFNMVGTITVQGAANTPPTVSLTSPGDGATFSTTDTITFSADAADPGGSVAKVEFFDGANKIGEDTSSPFSITGTLAAGTHSITAKATDNGGLTATSGARTITVNAPQNQAPVVSITSPTSGATFLTSDIITINANATDDGSIAMVEFFSDGNLIGTDTTFRYSITANLPAGTHSLTARATDNTGLTATSAAVIVAVNSANQSPSVSISSPQGGTTIATTGTITLSATATDDGQIAQVEFFNGGNSITVDTTAPYEASVSNLAPGTYTFTAVAKDNTGATTTSTGIQVRVAAAPQTSISLNGSTITINATGTDGVTYDLERTTDFVTWSKVTSATPTGGTMSFTDTMGPTVGFYRVVAR